MYAHAVLNDCKLNMEILVGALDCLYDKNKTFYHHRFMDAVMEMICSLIDMENNQILYL